MINHGAAEKELSKKYCTKTGTALEPKQLKKGSGFLILRYFFVQVAIVFLFCSSPMIKNALS